MLGDLPFHNVCPVCVCGAMSGPVERVADVGDEVVVRRSWLRHLLSMVMGESVAYDSMRVRKKNMNNRTANVNELFDTYRLVVTYNGNDGVMFSHLRIFE